MFEAISKKLGGIRQLGKFLRGIFKRNSEDNEDYYTEIQERDAGPVVKFMILLAIISTGYMSTLANFRGLKIWFNADEKTSFIGALALTLILGFRAMFYKGLDMYIVLVLGASFFFSIGTWSQGIIENKTIRLVEDPYIVVKKAERDSINNLINSRQRYGELLHESQRINKAIVNQDVERLIGQRNIIVAEINDMEKHVKDKGSTTEEGIRNVVVVLSWAFRVNKNKKEEFVNLMLAMMPLFFCICYDLGFVYICGRARLEFIAYLLPVLRRIYSEVEIHKLLKKTNRFKLIRKKKNISVANNDELSKKDKAIIYLKQNPGAREKEVMSHVNCCRETVRKAKLSISQE
jgi:hypothetical protein